MIAFKIVTKISNGLISSRYAHHVWKPGVNKADKCFVPSYGSIYRKMEGRINHAIHVYLKKPKKSFVASNKVVIPVICHIDDFIAASFSNAAAFKKVFLTTQDYNRACKAGKIYYKVVQRIWGGLISPVAPYGLHVEYVPQLWVMPRIGTGRLCVFDSLDKARDFKDVKGGEIWECQIGQAFYTCDIALNISDYPTVAKLKESKKKYTELCYKAKDFPSGTVFTDRVMLTRRAS